MVKFISVHNCMDGCKEKFLEVLESKGVNILNLEKESYSDEFLSSKTEMNYSDWVISRSRQNQDTENIVIVVFDDLARNGIDLGDCEGYFIQLTDTMFYKDEDKYDVTIYTQNKKIMNDKIDILIK